MDIRRSGDMDNRYREMIRSTLGDVDISAIELFRSMAKSFHMLTGLLERDLARNNLSGAKLRVLLWLKLRQDEGANGGGMLPSELSRFQGVTPNTMSSLLTSLREAGLIEQINHPQDRRKRVIKITPAGLDTLRTLGPTHYRYIAELLEALSEEERQILITLLHKVISSIRARMAAEGIPMEHPHHHRGPSP
jgi:DNA-binding MarR family transcriptional regulator